MCRASFRGENMSVVGGLGTGVTVWVQIMVRFMGTNTFHGILWALQIVIRDESIW
jgi:hypothetical protein